MRATRPGRPRGSEQARVDVVDATHRVVVEREARDPAVGREHAGLRLDLLGGEHPAHGRQERVAVEQVEVARELLDTVNMFKIRLLVYNKEAIKWRTSLCDV